MYKILTVEKETRREDVEDNVGVSKAETTDVTHLQLSDFSNQTKSSFMQYKH